MRKVIEYQCEKCGTHYESEEEARECESYHKTPEIIGCRYGRNNVFPDSITIRADGEQYTYEYRRL